MSDVRQFPEQAEIVKSGPIRFGDDWPGYFLRGDHALALAIRLDRAAAMAATPVDRFYLSEAAKELRQWVPNVDPTVTPSGVVVTDEMRAKAREVRDLEKRIGGADYESTEVERGKQR